MPTPVSAAAFAKLVASRDRLTEITKRLNEFYSTTTTFNVDGFTAHGGQYEELQAEWDGALQEFVSATAEFSARVRDLKVERDNPPLPGNFRAKRTGAA